MQQQFYLFINDGILSRTWSDREIRTLLAKIYNLPLDWSAVRYFEEVVTNCSLQQNNYLPLEHQLGQKFVYSTLVYERYEDSTIVSSLFHTDTDTTHIGSISISAYGHQKLGAGMSRIDRHDENELRTGSSAQVSHQSKNWNLQQLQDADVEHHSGGRCAGRTAKKSQEIQLH